MAIEVAIYIPSLSFETIATGYFTEFLAELGDVIAVDFGNNIDEEINSLEELRSFIIIDEVETPKIENFSSQVLVIPVEKSEVE